MSREIAREIQIQLTREESRRLDVSRRIDPAAYDEYLLGLAHRRKLGPDEVKQAVAHLERAIQLKPDYAQAYAELSEAWLELETRDAETPARNAVTKALDLDPELAEAHASLGRLKVDYDWDWTGADREYQRALSLSPTSLDVCECYPYLLVALGRAPEAFSILDRTLERSPLSSSAQAAYGAAFYFTRRYSESILHLQRAIEIDPANLTSYIWLSEAYEQLRDYPNAIEAAEKATRGFGGDPRKNAGTGRLYLEAGRRADAQYALSSALQLQRGPAAIGALYFAFGDRDKGFQWLAKSLDERVRVHLLKVDPVYDDVRSDPRFQALLHRIGLD